MRTTAAPAGLALGQSLVKDQTMKTTAHFTVGSPTHNSSPASPMPALRQAGRARQRASGPGRGGTHAGSTAVLLAAGWLLLAGAVRGQTLVNVDFGVGKASAKSGWAATGQTTNDFWNLYRHYDPKYTAGMALVADGRLDNLKLADGSDSRISILVSNAPGVWGNSSGDPMYDSFIFAQNGSNLVVTVRNLAPGSYYLYLYGHADPDVVGEQNSVFTLRVGTNSFGPLATAGSGTWRTNAPMREFAQYVVFRDLPVPPDQAVRIEVAPSPGGVAVLNGLQIFSRGTSPPKLFAATAAPLATHFLDPHLTNLLFHEIRYEGKVSDTEARFAVTLTAESFVTNEISGPLFEGEVALLPGALPPGARLTGQGRESRLYLEGPGFYTLQFELVARIQRHEPWNEISFVGPPTAMASVTARSEIPGLELQLLNGTQLEKSNASVITGSIGADRVLALRWQSRATEITRKSLLTVDTTARALVKPAGIEYATTLRYEILQAPAPRLLLDLPTNQTLTRLQGPQIRDWQVKTAGPSQRLTVEFIKPMEKNCELTLFSEQATDTRAATVALALPQPLEVERESGAIAVVVEEVLVEIASSTGLRQANAPAGALTAYRFNGRPFALTAKVTRLEPVLKVHDRVTVRAEETRATVHHALNLTVEKAGLYALDLAPQPGFVVSEVRGEGLEDWKLTPGPAPDRKNLRVSFGSRVFGTRKLEVLLEQAHKTFAEKITVLPLGLTGATNLTVQIGAASSAGIRLKTEELSGLREVPIHTLSARADELLAFTSDTPDWSLTLAAEKLQPRVVSEVFNLITVGDGLVGGSATIRYGILNQGVQEFQVALPARWRNVEFTGASIRRKEQAALPVAGAPAPNLDTNAVLWTITLQDKAWGGYTLVITYDYQFDPKGATLDLTGAHPVGVERETGSLGLMTAANLQINPAPAADPLRRVDESELSETDRALCTRPLLLAYRYAAPGYRHSVQVTRFDEMLVLDAVADRTELISVVNEEGQMLTQASFMVKNNEKQTQQFRLPAGARLWTTFVNGQPAKPERDGDFMMVPLPRGLNRDQAFAVDIVYAQTNELGKGWFPRRLELLAPVTDIPNTYAEWQLFVPMSQRLSGFDGNMTVARGTTYGLRDAWEEFVEFYGTLIERHWAALALCLGLGLLIVLMVAAAQHGFQLVLQIALICGILAILAGMLLPSLARAKSKAQRISSVSNLKQVGLAARLWASDHGDKFPSDYDQFKQELGSEKVTRDTQTGQTFVWVGAGKDDSDPRALLAYSPTDNNGRYVLFADGSVQQMNSEKFNEAVQLDASLQAQRRSTGQAGTINAPMVANAPPPPANAGQVVGFDNNRPSVQTQATASQPPPGPGAPAVMGANPAMAAPVRTTAGGVRPIRIDVPRAGHQFSFTKVLNVRREPLSIRVSAMRTQTYRRWQMVGQVTGFLVGLGLFWGAWQAPRRSSFWLAIAASLIVGSVGSLLMLWRLLGSALIAVVALGLLLGCLWLAARLLKRTKKGDADLPPSARDTTPPAAAAEGSGAALLLLLGALGAGQSVQGGEPSAAGLKPEPVNPISIVSATYTGTIYEKAAQFDVTIALSTATTNQLVPLFGDDVAIQEFKDGEAAKLMREGRRVGVFVAARTNATVHFKLLAKVGGDITKRTVAFAIPPALASRLSATLGEPDAEVEFPTAVTFKRTVTNQQTRVEAVLGATDRLEMNWTPRVKRAAEIAATVFCQNTALATFGGGVINLRSTLEYQVSQGELKQARVRLPAGQRLLRVEGEAIRTWELKPEAGAEVLIVDLLKAVSPAYKLTVETEKVLEKLPASARVELPHALEVKREAGLVGLRGSEELALTVESVAELRRVDAEEFTKAMPAAQEGLVSAFRFLGSAFTLVVRAEAIQPQLEATVRNEFRLGFESLTLAAQVNHLIKRAGLFSLRLALPSAWRLEGVEGEKVQQWSERTKGTNRWLEIALQERLMGAHTLRVNLSQSWKEPPKSLNLTGVTPLDTEKLSGFVTVTSEIGIGLKTVAFDGLTEVPYATVGAERAAGGALAWKFVGSEPAATWKLTVATETVEAWVRAEVANTFTIAETLVTGRGLVRYDIANAPVKELRLRVPAAARNVEISGANIRRRDQATNEWRLELQSKVRGEYLLNVTWEQPKESKSNLVALTGIEVIGAERESGSLAIVAKAPLQVTEKAASELLNKIDVRELPAWAGQAGATAVLCYHYVRPGYHLLLEARRFEEAEVLEALVDGAQLTTVVADDGQMMTQVTLNLRNNARQHLEVELPPGATNWSAFVADEPVRPSKRDGGRLLLPLERTSGSDAPVKVELTFVSEGHFPKSRGRFALASPKFDVPMKNTRWDLYLPPDYDYSRFEGSMTRSADTADPLVQVYSLSQYTQQETEKAAEQRRNFKLGLSNAKQELAGGKMREALNLYNRAKKPASQQADYDDSNELQQIAKDVKRVQSSNLILAQNNWAYENASRLGAVAQQPQGQAAPPQQARQNQPAQLARGDLNGDVEVAGQQWEKLEAAQQVAVAKISPLRVNLPTRGVRYAFTQVLQTEPSKPVTIQLHAQNTRLPSWSHRFGLLAVSFLALWAAMAVAARRRE